MSKNKKTTGKDAAANASKTLQSKDTGETTKLSSASALSQTGDSKRETSPEAATAASKTMRDGRTSEASKSAAGSTLAQTPSK